MYEVADHPDCGISHELTNALDVRAIGYPPKFFDRGGCIPVHPLVA